LEAAATAGELWGCPGKVGLGAEAPEAVNQHWEASAILCGGCKPTARNQGQLPSPELVKEDLGPFSS
jgi:hypothetical protein